MSYNRKKNSQGNTNSTNTNTARKMKRRLKIIVYFQLLTALFLSVSTIFSLIVLPKIENLIENREKMLTIAQKKSEKSDLIDIKNYGNMILCDLYQFRNEISKFSNPKISKSLENGAIQELAFLIMQTTYYWNDSLGFFEIKKMVDKQIDDIYLDPKNSFNDKIRLLQDLFNKKNESFVSAYNKNISNAKKLDDKLVDLKKKKKITTNIFALFQLLGIILLAVLSAYEKLTNMSLKE